MMNFSECGHGAHVHSKVQEVRGHKWVPTVIYRPDKTKGYMKCTTRSVQLMRFWTDFWYPICVYQQGLFRGPGKYDLVRHDEFFLAYTRERIFELEAVSPEAPWRDEFNAWTEENIGTDFTNLE